MHLILWRHAQTEPGTPVELRPLTRKGEKQAVRMARWLKPYLPKKLRIIASPATRAQQTVQALAMPYETSAELAQGNDAESILASLNWPHNGESVLIAGHNPALGQMAALLLAGQHAEWAIKKGGIWWFTYQEKPDEPNIILQLAMTPDLLKRALR